MSAADVASPFASLVRSLVERETDHEQIAASCGVPRTLAHDERTKAIVSTIQFLARSRDAWASQALTWRAHFCGALRATGDAEPISEDTTPDMISARLHAIGRRRWQAVRAVAAIYGMTAERDPDTLLRELHHAAESAERSRAAWTDDARTAAEALARIADALDLYLESGVSLDPRDAPRIAAKCVAAIEALTDRPTTETRPVNECAAVSALADVATALGVEHAYADADSVAVEALKAIERDQKTIRGALATIESLTARATIAERRAAALTRAVGCKSFADAPITAAGVSRYLIAHGWTYRADLNSTRSRWTYDEPLRTGETHRHTIYTHGLQWIESADIARLAMIESRNAHLIVAEMIERSDEIITPEGGQ